jgi:hypothetical protein
VGWDTLATSSCEMLELDGNRSDRVRSSSVLGCDLVQRGGTLPTLLTRDYWNLNRLRKGLIDEIHLAD